MGNFIKNAITQILSSPRADWVISVDDVKDLSKDYPEFQELFVDISSEEDYEKCIARALLDFNNAMVPTQFSLCNFPDPYLLLKKAFAEYLRVLEAYHASNYFTGSSGGVQVPLHERFQNFAPLRASLEDENRARQQALKTQLNYLDGFGGIDYYSFGSYSYGY